MVLPEMAPPPPSAASLQPATKLSQATATLVAQHSMGLSPQHRSAPGRGLSRPFHPPSPSVSLIMPRPASTTAARVISSKSPRAALLISRQELGSVAAVLQHGRLPRGRRGGSGSRAPSPNPGAAPANAQPGGLQPPRSSCLVPSTAPWRLSVLRQPCPEAAALGPSPAQSSGRRARSRSVAVRDGLVGGGRNAPALLQNPGAATRARVSRGSNSQRGGGGGDRFPGR